MSVIRRPLTLLALLLPGSGCSYLADRGLDLAQTVELAAGWSEGLEANVRATKFVQLGFGSYRGIYWFGLQDGRFDTWQEERSELGIGPLYVHEVFRSRTSRRLDLRFPLFGDPGFREHPFDLTHLSDRGLFEVGLTVNPVLFGLDVAVPLAEVVDLVAGIATFDPLQDDVYAPTLEELSRRLSGENARVRAAAARALRWRTGEDHGYVIYGAPEQMPAFQIQAIRRWRERLDTLVPEPRAEPVDLAFPPADPPAEEDVSPSPPNTPPASP